MTDRNGQPPQQPSPAHTSRDCHLCGIYRHPAQAQTGRALQAHLAANPFPRQAANA